MLCMQHKALQKSHVTYINTLEMNTNKPNITELIKHRVLLLDGSMGVMIQTKNLDESQFRGSILKSHPKALKGNNDILCLTSPEIIKSIHRDYLEAGADIIETNTFNATIISQREYNTEHLVDEINISGAKIAKAIANEYSTAERPRFVAGSIGPTGVAASMSADINDPAARLVTFQEMSDAFYRQAKALILGGVDLLLIETIFDSLNAKAAINGAKKAFSETNTQIPIILSITISDQSGRILSGHTPEAFLSIINHASPLAVGFNCSGGPANLAPFARQLASISPYPTILYPNLGLPDSLGRYTETTESFVGAIKPLLNDGILNIIGGCCGTSPEQIAALRKVLDIDTSPRKLSTTNTPWLAGLDAFYDNRGFINIGERCNVAGSRKFLRLINEKSYNEAVAIARKQVADGAMILDINMDDGLLNIKEEMIHFLRLLSTDPDVSSVPWMIDSSDFDVIVSALENTPGRAIVNSISLKHGEEEFLSQARIIKEYGAAVVIMAFDEEGQATTFERKISICERAYKLLTEKADFDARDIIFDPNVLTIATGMAEHDKYALDFISAVEWIHTNLPGAKTSGGLSNLSFAFRGNNYLRQAMHAVFLYHAIKAGLSMAIMDPAAKVTYDSIPEELLTLLEDAILCRRKDAAERLIEQATNYSTERQASSTISDREQMELPVEKRLENALIRGDETTLESDIHEAVTLLGNANAVVEGPLMDGMERVGEMFECGKMFLPQVVKSARTMHRAVEILRPQLEANKLSGATKGTFLVATVKGDVHDIGKNIAAVVLRCNNFNVIDLGVQVDAHTIVEAALKYNPDFIGLSGLISPSLGEMANVALALRNAGIETPLFVGGAATSEIHTALKIAPEYGNGVVVRVADASQNPIVATRLLNNYEEESKIIKTRQQQLREVGLQNYKPGNNNYKPILPNADEIACAPTFIGVKSIDEPEVKEIVPFINWAYFYNCWKVVPNSEAATDLRRDADAILSKIISKGATMRCRVGFFKAHSDGDKIVVNTPAGEVVIDTPRQNAKENRTELLSLADFVGNREINDHIGCFTITIGQTLRNMLLENTFENDSYTHLLLQSVCDRLAEATSEWLHYKVRTSLWGYAPNEPLDFKAIKQGKYQGIRPAIGYPSLPDQMLMHTLNKLINFEELEIIPTENGALTPSSTVAGLYISSLNCRYFTL